jgi:Outer membrane protein beta-barrel domain
VTRLRGFAASARHGARARFTVRARHGLLLFVTLAVPSPALAQSSFEIGGGVTWTGGFSAGGLDASLARPANGSPPLPLFATDSRVEGAAGAIARAAWFVTPRIAVEGGVGFSRPTLRTRILDDFEQATGSEAEVAISSFVFGGSVLYHFGASRFVPFASAGAGRLRQLDEDNVNLVTGTELHAGGGVKYRLSRHLGLRVDAAVSTRDKSLAFEEKRRTVPVIGAGATYRF